MQVRPERVRPFQFAALISLPDTTALRMWLMNVVLEVQTPSVLAYVAGAPRPGAFPGPPTNILFYEMVGTGAHAPWCGRTLSSVDSGEARVPLEDLPTSSG